MENNFTRTIKAWLIDELTERKGEDGSYYPSDIAYTLTESINATGSVHCSSYTAKQFIKENFDEFGELLEYCINDLELTADNPFTEPEKWEVIAYIEGVRYLLNSCESLTEAQSEYAQITLDNALIDAIIDELQNNDFDITF